MKTTSAVNNGESASRHVGGSHTTISIRQSPPLSYESVRQRTNEVDRSLTSGPYDLAPSSRHQPGSLLSATLTTPSKAPSGVRSRPLPIPVQPKLAATDLRPSGHNQPISPPLTSSTSSHCPPPAVNSFRRRPLPQPGIPPSAHSASSSQSSSFLSSSSTSNSQPGSHLSSDSSLSTTSNLSHFLQSSSPQHPSHRASTMPTVPIQISRDQAVQDQHLVPPRRADTQPNSAPPSSAGFIITTAIGSRDANVNQVEAAENGKAKSMIKQDDRGARGSEISKGLPGATAIKGSAAIYPSAIANYTLTLPEVDLGARISPGSVFSTPKPELFAAKDEMRSEADKRTEENELGLSGLSKKSKVPVPSQPSQSTVPPQLPPPPSNLPPLPPSHNQRPVASAPATQPTSVGTVSLKPIVNHTSSPAASKKNRPVLAVRTWDLDSRTKTKKEQRHTSRNVPPLPSKTNGALKVTNNQTRGSSRLSSLTPKKMRQSNAASNPPSTGGQAAVRVESTQPKASTSMASTVASSTAEKQPTALGPGIPAQSHSTQPKSAGLASQLKKMKLLHRKSISTSDWNWTGVSSNLVHGTLQERSGSTPAALPSASASMTNQNQVLFGQRHPYGYQRGAAACSLTSVGASMITTSGSSMVHSAVPRSDPFYPNVANAPNYLPLSAQPGYTFPSAPHPTPVAPAESKKSIGTLWSKFKFGSTRKATTGMMGSKKTGLVELW